MTTARDVLAEVLEEREAQDEKWGEQNHPDGTGPIYAAEADYQRKTCNDLFEQKMGSWSAILLAEVYETLAEPDSTALHAELIRVAAVCASWVEAIDRRTP